MALPPSPRRAPADLPGQQRHHRGRPRRCARRCCRTSTAATATRRASTASGARRARRSRRARRQVARAASAPGPGGSSSPAAAPRPTTWRSRAWRSPGADDGRHVITTADRAPGRARHLPVPGAAPAVGSPTCRRGRRRAASTRTTLAVGASSRRHLLWCRSCWPTTRSARSSRSPSCARSPTSAGCCSTPTRSRPRARSRSTSRSWASTCSASPATSFTGPRASARSTCARAWSSSRWSTAASRSGACGPAPRTSRRSSGSGKAAELARSRLSVTRTACAALRDRLEAGIRELVPGAPLNGHRGRSACPTRST